MTIKEAILQSLEDLQQPLIYAEVYEQIVKKNYYNFGSAKTPKFTISHARRSEIDDKRLD
jgi:hypothetical protein